MTSLLLMAGRIIVVDGIVIPPREFHAAYNRLLIYLTLCMLGNFSCFCCRLVTFFKIIFFENSFRINIREANSFDPDQDQQNVGPDLGPNCLQWI